MNATGSDPSITYYGPKNFRIRNWFSISGVGLALTITAAAAAPLPETTPERVGLSSEHLRKIDRVFEAGVSEGQIPGAVIAIARHGKLAYFKAHGMQNTTEGIPMRTDSIFRIYSMTKPIVSVGAMMLHEDARLYLPEPVGKYLPELTEMTVAQVGRDLETGSNTVEVVPANAAITIHDLLRHTSGFTYGFYGQSPAKQQLKQSGLADLNALDLPLAKFVDRLAILPLAYQPGQHWEYGRSADVLGRLIEVVSGDSLDTFLKADIFDPLGMVDTGFWVPEKDWPRIAEPLQNTGEPELIDVSRPPKLLAGGHGLVSTAGDFLRFCQMLLNGGTLDSTRILGPKTVKYMTANHLHDGISRAGPYYLPGPGYGFGLGFGIREANGISPWPGSKGEYFWGGYAGTYFWVDPAEELIVVSMSQSVIHRTHYRMLLRNLVYQAIVK